MADVAREAGVSRGTVSRYLNETSYVSQHARASIADAISRVGFVPNAAARLLAGSRTQTVLLLVREQAGLFTHDPNLAGMMVGANRALNEAHHQMLVMLVADDEQLGRARRTLAGGLIDAVMIASARHDDPVLAMVESLGVPAAIVGRPADGTRTPSVDVDNIAGAREIVTRLRATGRRTLAMIGGPADMNAAHDRIVGFREAAGDVAERLILRTADWSRAAGAHAMSELLDRAPDIDGVFAASDALAYGAMDALTAAGRSIPGDVGVVGFDDTHDSLPPHPALSTVSQPAEGLGIRMAELVMRQLGGEDLTGARVYESTRIVWRDSA